MTVASKIYYPPFAFPAKFAELAGLSSKEVRRLCRQKILPNERTRKGFRIDVEAGLAALRDRAATFAGHEPTAPAHQHINSNRVKSCNSNKVGFLAALESLKGAK